MKRTCMVLLVFVLVCSATLALAYEKKAKGKVVLPEAVLSAFKAAYPKAEIKAVSKEPEKGMIYYEVESIDGKQQRNILYTADGKAAEIEETLDTATLPEAVTQTLSKEFPGAKLLKAEALTKDGQKSFEVQIQLKGKKKELAFDASGKEAELAKGEQKGEIQVAPDGKVVEGPKWKKEEAEEKEELGEKAEAEEKGESKLAAVDLKILPLIVLSTFQTDYPHAVIKGTSKETEKGVTYYEVESVDGKMKRDLLYTADGKAVEVEEVIVPGVLPPAVLQALAKAYPGYKILNAEDIVKGDQKFFELQIQVKGKKIGVTIDPSGKISE
jgi:hypothetical protein